MDPKRRDARTWISGDIHRRYTWSFAWPRPGSIRRRECSGSGGACRTPSDPTWQVDRPTDLRHEEPGRSEGPIPGGPRRGRARVGRVAKLAEMQAPPPDKLSPMQIHGIVGEFYRWLVAKHTNDPAGPRRGSPRSNGTSAGSIPVVSVRAGRGRCGGRRLRSSWPSGQSSCPTRTCSRCRSPASTCSPRNDRPHHALQPH